MEIRPIPLATLRVSLAGFVVLAWLLCSRPKVPSLPHLARFVLCGLFGFPLNSVCINIGQTTVTAGATSFIVNIIPILTALLAWVLLGERFGPMGWLDSLTE